MDLPRSWADLLSARGIDPTGAVATRFEHGESTDVWRVDVPTRSAKEQPADTWVVRRHRPTGPTEELDFELAASAALARAGFPTPAPLPNRSDGTFWTEVDGAPTTLWPFVPGHHPASLADGYGSMDQEIGRGATRLVAKMHQLLHGTELPGRRSPARVPWVAVGSFLASDPHRHPVFAPMLEPLVDAREGTRAAHEVPGVLPSGMVHHDVNAGNLLLDDEGEIVALLDFGDCMQSVLTYELASVIGNFAVDPEHHVDVPAARSLIEAYDEVRTLTVEERRLLPDLLALHAGAETIDVVGGWIADGVVDPRLDDSFSARQFADLVAARDELQSRSW